MGKVLIEVGTIGLPPSADAQDLTIQALVQERADDGWTLRAMAHLPSTVGYTVRLVFAKKVKGT